MNDVVKGRTKEKAVTDMTQTEAGNSREETRARILAAAIELLSSQGRDAVTTRAVADTAGVQAPTLYRLFGDKEGLLDAVAEHGFSLYLKDKGARPLSDDPVEDLRTGWDLHIEFGLSHPAVYLLMYADPRPGNSSPAAQTSYRLLQSHVRRVAATGRLRVSEERATNLIHSCACGIVLTLLAMPAEARDSHLSGITRDAALAAVINEVSTNESRGHVGAAIALRASLPADAPLSGAERALLTEWLDRLASGE